MWPRSARWDKTITQSHDVLAYVEILSDGDAVMTVDAENADVDLLGGTVHIAEGVVRRTASLTLVDVNSVLVPIIDQSLIVPGNNEIRIWAGVRYADATAAEIYAGTDSEYVPVFTGPITDLDLGDYPQVGITCSDRMSYCQRPFSSPYTVTAGQTLDDGIRSLLTAKVPPLLLTANLPVTDLTTRALVYDEQADPSDALRTMATAAGWSLYVNPMGVFVATTEPALDPDLVVMSYVAGPNGALIKPRLSMSLQNIVNTWVVTGESVSDTAAIPYAKAVDDDPSSVTYVRSTYDERPRFISSPLLTTDAQCLLAAQTYRRREGGLADSVTVEVLPNPALEKGDVITVTGGLVDRMIIADSFDLDLSGGAQQIAARAGTADSG